MKRIYLLLAVLVTAIIFISCATIFKGSSQDISIMSRPDKANITIKTMGGVEVYNGVTPTTLSLSKKREYLVTVKLDGYKETMVQITQSLQGWFWGNLLCGGIIGMIIDFTSGSMWDLEPEAINISLLTAHNNGNENQTYAVFRTMDNEGQLRVLLVPMIRNDNQVAIGK